MGGYRIKLKSPPQVSRGGLYLLSEGTSKPG